MKLVSSALIAAAIFNVGQALSFNDNSRFLRRALEATDDETIAGKVDVVFVVDISGSFADDLPNFKSQAPGLIEDLQDSASDLRVGLCSFSDYAVYPHGSWKDVPYKRDIDLTSDTSQVLSAINSLAILSGGDYPESQLTALWEAAAGDEKMTFRDDAIKIFILWTDAAFHDSPTHPGPTLEETVAAIHALDSSTGGECSISYPARVACITPGNPISDCAEVASATNTFAPAGGLDCDGDGTIDIPEGQPIVCTSPASGYNIGTVVVEAVEAIVESVSPVSLSGVPEDIVLECGEEVPPVPTVTATGGCGDEITVTMSEVSTTPGCGVPGEIVRTWTGTDSAGNTVEAAQVITIEASAAPTASCNVHDISPDDVSMTRPIAFTPTVTDSCSAATVNWTGYTCTKVTGNGRVIDAPCKIEFEDGEALIYISGGVGTTIVLEMETVDACGNSVTMGCPINVLKRPENPL